jgi:hypothetical protein
MKTFKKLKASLEPGNASPQTEKISKDKNKSSSRFWGTKSLSNIYRKETPGQIPEVNNLDLTDLDEPIANLKKKQKQTINKSDSGLPGQEIRVQR